MANRGFFGIPPGGESPLVWIRIRGAEFANSWVNFDADTVANGRFCSYAKDERTGLVYLRGLMKSGTLPGIAFYLPPGYRPTLLVSSMYFPVTSNTAFGSVYITSADGSLYVGAGSATWVSLNGIVFPTAF